MRSERLVKYRKEYKLEIYSRLNTAEIGNFYLQDAQFFIMISEGFFLITIFQNRITMP